MRYRYAIHSALIDVIKRVNESMNNFGYEDHKLGFKIGTIDSNIPVEETPESMRVKLEKAMNEHLKESGQEVWLYKVGEVESKEG